MVLILHIILSLYLPLFGLFLFSSSYYKFLSLSLSLSLSHFLLDFFYEVCPPIVLLLTNLYVLLDASIFFFIILFTAQNSFNVVDQI